MSSSTTLLPFQPLAMSAAQSAAVSYLARYSGRTHNLYAFQLRRWFSWCETTASTRWLGSSVPMSSSTSASSASPG